MSTREDIIQSFRTWAKDLLGLTDAQIIPAERGASKGPRPSLPYLVVNVIVHDLEVGQVETKLTALGRARKGVRSGTVTIQAFDDGDYTTPDSSEWLELLSLYSDTAPDPLTVVPIPGLNDISTDVDGTIEERYQMDYTVYYAVRSETTNTNASDPAAKQVNVDTSLEGGSPTTSISENL